jgi:hypothetical protein
MEIKRENIGRIALLDKAVSDLNKLIDNGDLSKKEAYGIIKRLNTDIKSAEGPIINVPKIQESIIYNYQFEDIVQSINYNYIYYAAELDLLNSVSKVVAAFIDGEIERARIILSDASDMVDILKVYMTATVKNANTIFVKKEDFNSSDFDITDGYITSKIGSEKSCSITGIDISTNGMVGNLLELENTVDKYRPLESYEVKFIDESSTFSNKARLKDKNENTVFEVEAYEVVDDKDTSIIPLVIKKGTLLNGINTYQEIKWNLAPSNGKLTCLIGIDSSTPFNILSINPNLNSDYQKVKSITVSKDGKTWYLIAEDVFLVAGINTFDERFSEYKGRGAFYIPYSGIMYARIEMEQDTPYIASIAHCLYHKEKETIPQMGEIWSVTNEDKTELFRSGTIKINDIELCKDAMAIDAKRWRISLKDIDLTAAKYSRESILETKPFSIGGNIAKVGISVKEIIPEGCSIKYELSHNNGISWNEINPIERNSNIEIISFSSSEKESKLKSMKYVKVDVLPTSLILRITIHTDKNSTPAIKNITINPVLSMEF